jgi:hypothetical protein
VINLQYDNFCKSLHGKALYRYPTKPLGGESAVMPITAGSRNWRSVVKWSLVLRIKLSAGGQFIAPKSPTFL